MREGIFLSGCLEIEGQVSKGMRPYWMVDWIGIENCCRCFFLALLLFKRSLNIQESHVLYLVIKVGAFWKTETRRKAGEANCGSGKALPLSETRQAGTAQVP